MFLYSRSPCTCNSCYPSSLTWHPSFSAESYTLTLVTQGDWHLHPSMFCIQVQSCPPWLWVWRWQVRNQQALEQSSVRQEGPMCSFYFLLSLNFFSLFFIPPELWNTIMDYTSIANSIYQIHLFISKQTTIILGAVTILCKLY